MVFGTFRDWEQRRVDVLMRVVLPDGSPMFRSREEALAALRRLTQLHRYKEAVNKSVDKKANAG